MFMKTKLRKKKMGIKEKDTFISRWYVDNLNHQQYQGLRITEKSIRIRSFKNNSLNGLFIRINL